MAHLRMNKRLTEDAVREFSQMLRQAGSRGLRTVDFIGTNHFHGMRTLTEHQVRRVLRKIPNIKCDGNGGGWIYEHRYWYLPMDNGVEVKTNDNQLHHEGIDKL